MCKETPIAGAEAGRYRGLSEDATLRDVVLVVRADEAHHRDVNHGFANEIAGLPLTAMSTLPPCGSPEACRR